MESKARRLTEREIEQLLAQRSEMIEAAIVEPVERAVSRPRIVKGKKRNGKDR